MPLIVAVILAACFIGGIGAIIYYLIMIVIASIKHVLWMRLLERPRRGHEASLVATTPGRNLGPGSTTVSHRDGSHADPLDHLNGKSLVPVLPIPASLRPGNLQDTTVPQLKRPLRSPLGDRSRLRAHEATCNYLGQGSQASTHVRRRRVAGDAAGEPVPASSGSREAENAVPNQRHTLPLHTIVQDCVRRDRTQHLVVARKGCETLRDLDWRS